MSDNPVMAKMHLLQPQIQTLSQDHIHFELCSEDIICATSQIASDIACGPDSSF